MQTSKWWNTSNKAILHTSIFISSVWKLGVSISWCINKDSLRFITFREHSGVGVGGMPCVWRGGSVTLNWNISESESSGCAASRQPQITIKRQTRAAVSSTTGVDRCERRGARLCECFTSWGWAEPRGCLWAFWRLAAAFHPTPPPCCGTPEKRGKRFIIKEVPPADKFVFFSSSHIWRTEILENK